MNIYGHRGSAGRLPENTMISFEGAWEDGADGIELDVQMTKDGNLVVIHDETVNRTTNGTGFVKEYTYNEIRLLNAGITFGLEGCKIPTLEEVYNWALDNDLKLNVELKNGLINYYGLEEEVINLTRRYSYERRVILSSFNHLSMWKCNQLANDIETALIATQLTSINISYLKEYGVQGIHTNYKHLSKNEVDYMKNIGYKIRVYTPNKKEDITKLKNWEVNSIITDFPKKAVLLL